MQRKAGLPECTAGTESPLSGVQVSAEVIPQLHELPQQLMHALHFLVMLQAYILMTHVTSYTAVTWQCFQTYLRRCQRLHHSHADRFCALFSIPCSLRQQTLRRAIQWHG